VITKNIELYIHFDVSVHRIRVTGFLTFRFTFVSASLNFITFRQDLTCRPQVLLIINLLLVVNVSVGYLAQICSDWGINNK